MQFAKDSFYMALLVRLVALNPERTVTVNGTTRPALIVAENELVFPVQPLPDTFYLEWGSVASVKQQTGSKTLMMMDCLISYHTFGTVESSVDRGRALGALDTEFLSICQAPRASKRDYTQTPSVDLGTDIFWTTPELGKITGSNALKSEGLPRGTEGARLERIAAVKVFFFSEVNFL
jgi:hypothetical protein